MADNLNYSRVRSESDATITPVGTILPWSQATAPFGFLKCDGSAVSRATYADLFDVIGTTYGVGDGSTTFNLPNLTSRTLVGANTTTNIGQTAGSVDTTAAGFSLNQNLATQNTQNLAAAVTENLAVQTTENLSVQTTQNLGIQVTENLALQVTENLAAASTQNLVGNVSGNVANHTLTTGEIPTHNHPGSSHMGAFNGPYSNTAQTRHTGTGNSGNTGSSTAHGHNHNLGGSVTGNATHTLTGNVTGNVAGSAPGAVTGTLNTNLTGNAVAAVSGAVTTNITGNVGVNLTGNVTVQNASLYQPHLVTIYIIKF